MRDAGEQSDGEPLQRQKRRAEPEQQRAFMCMFRGLYRLAEKGFQRHCKGDGKHQPVAENGNAGEQHGTRIAMRERIINLFLGKKTKEGRQAGHGNRGRQRRRKGDGHGSSQAAKLCHVACAGLMVDDTGDHEQCALEQGMRHQIEHRRLDGMVGAETRQHDQQAERRHRGIGEHQLKIGLAYGKQRAGEHGQPAEEGQQYLPGGGIAQNRIKPHQQIDAGLHHGRGVQIGRNGGRRLHGVGQPEMKGKLRRFREGTAEHQQQRGQIKRAVTQDIAAAHQHRQLRHPAHVPDEDQPGKQQQPAAAGHHQCLQCGAARGGTFMVETDQQEGGDGGQLPVDEQHQQTVRDDDAQHRAHEQQQERQESALLRMPLHVAAGIKHDQQADAGDQQRKGERQAVDEPGKAEIETWDPRITARHHAASRHLRQHQCEMDKGKRRRNRQYPGGIVPESLHQRRCGERREKRQK